SSSRPARSASSRSLLAVRRDPWLPVCGGTVTAVIGAPPIRGTAPRRPERRNGTPRHRGRPRADEGPAHRNTGSGTGWRVGWSYLHGLLFRSLGGGVGVPRRNVETGVFEVFLVRPGDPFGETLAGLALVEVMADDSFDVIG